MGLLGAFGGLGFALFRVKSGFLGFEVCRLETRGSRLGDLEIRTWGPRGGLLQS